MKVAYVLPSLEKPSGWRTHSIAMLNAIREYVELVLFVSSQDYEIARSLFPGDPLFPLPVTQQVIPGSLQGLRMLVFCYRTIRQGEYPRVDLVHSLEAYPTGLVGSWLAKRLDCPHAITTHGTYGVVWYDRPIERVIYRRVLRNTALVCPVSHGTARLLDQFFGEDIGHALVSPVLNGNEFYKVVPQSEALEKELPAIPTILTVGDVKPRKGQHLSLAAFELVKARFPLSRYWIAGRFQANSYYRGLQQLIAERHLQDVSFLGCISDDELSRCFRQASVFVLTPQPGEGSQRLHFEGFGLVYLEAGAYGLPVVATHTGGVPDAVQHGVTGLLAAPGDVQGIADAIIRILADPQLARMLGRANRFWAESLTWERSALEQVQVYRQLLGSK